MLFPVWLFFSAIFFYFAYINWRQGQSTLREFQFRQKEDEPAPREGDPSMKEFVVDFNRYLQSVNNANRARHRAAAFGFMVGGFVALVSMFLTIPGG